MIHNMNMSFQNQQENKNLVECDIKLISDKQTACEVIQLLSYIRNVLRNKQKKDISLKVGYKTISDFFGFSVNGQEIKDYIAKDVAIVN